MTHSVPKGPYKRARQIKRMPARVDQPTAEITKHYVCPACSGPHARADCAVLAAPEPDDERQWRAHMVASLHRRLPLS